MGYMSEVICRSRDLLSAHPLPADPRPKRKRGASGPALVDFDYAAHQRAKSVLDSFPSPVPFGHSGFGAYIEALRAWVSARGFEWPASYSDKAVAARFLDDAWVTSYVRTQILRADEEKLRRDGCISSRRSIYVSKRTKTLVAEAAASFLAFAENQMMYSSSGRSAKLIDLVNSGTANLENRRAEMMTRIRGLDEIAVKRGFIPLFLTASLPGRMHAVIQKTGKVNRKFDHSTVRDGQRLLTQQWALCRSALAAADIEYFGLRVAEPHHDSTPHWHMLVFVAPGSLKFELPCGVTIAAQKVDEFIRHFARSFSMGSEFDPDQGAHRVDVKYIDRDQGSAVGYVSKYVSKNIDGVHVNEEGSAARVRAWAARHGIRQFQFFGAGSVQIWREARRLGDEVSGQLGVIRDSAKSNAYSEFLSQLSDRPASLVRDAGSVNRFGERVAGRVLGLELGLEAAQTRFDRWASSAESAAEPLPWTRMNNCKLPSGAIELAQEDIDAAFDDKTPLDMESGWSEQEFFPNLGCAGTSDTTLNLRH